MSLAPVIDRLHDALNSRLHHRGDQVFHEIAENRIRDAKRDFDRINATIQAALSSSSKRVRIDIGEKEVNCRSCCGCFV